MKVSLSFKWLVSGFHMPYLLGTLRGSRALLRSGREALNIQSPRAQNGGHQGQPGLAHASTICYIGFNLQLFSRKAYKFLFIDIHKIILHLLP